MCGICGVVGCGNADVVRRMRDSLGHRLYRPKEVEKRVLNTIGEELDVATGKQMASADGLGH